MRLLLEHVRVFGRRQTPKIRPLTLLTGENSSGKTTFLAVLAAVCDPSGFPLMPAFNRDPYALGGYDTIATLHRGRTGRARSFSIGYTAESAREDAPTEAIATYESQRGEIRMSAFVARNAMCELSLQRYEENGRPRRRMRWQEGEGNEWEIVMDDARSEASTRPAVFLWVVDALEQGHEVRRGRISVDRVIKFAQRIGPGGALSLAPIRSKPSRTYERVGASAFGAEGAHVPFLLERLWTQSQSIKNKGRVLQAIAEYGKESGLYSEVSARRLGRNATDPFQLLIKNGKTAANIVDVGYGVSQALPVIAEATRARPERLVLLQQPEVHLHPRAQAALGSLFAQLVSTTRARFVIETHSDYIIDRVRYEVRRRTLKAEDVGILYFDRRDSETDIVEIGVDDQGNLVNVPTGYREFFLEEDYRILGGE